VSEQRLQKLIAKYGYASRRKAEELIKKGNVRVDGAVVDKPGFKLQQNALIEINGKIINREIPKVYLLLNKPDGCLCSRRDPHGRKTVYELLKKGYRNLGLFSIGRLDYMSSGLLILTNDGSLAHTISHPSSRIVKRYEVRTSKDIPYNLIDAWKNGVYIKGTRYRILDFTITGKKSITLELIEGKNREIRKLFENINVNVIKLKRIAVGSFELGDLASGQYREVSGSEMRERLFKHAR